MELRKSNFLHRNKSKIKRTLLGYAFMALPLVLFSFFVWVPMLTNVLLSFFEDYSFKNFVGFENYLYVFRDPQFLSALKNTFLYIFWSLLIGYLLPVVLGFLMSEVIHARAAFRILLYLPAMISGIAVVFLYKNLFGDEPYSILNIIIQGMGFEPHTWKGDPDLVIPLIVVAMTWKGAGSTALIYLSAFQNVDPSLYEASRIDGANGWQRFWHVTVPSVKNTLIMLLGLQIISVFQVFYEPLVIGNGGGPISNGVYSSLSLMLLSYNYGFIENEEPYSAATTVFLSLIIIGFTLLYEMLKKKLDGKGASK